MGALERILREVSIWYALLYVFFTFFSVYCVLNVVVGVFVDNTAESARKDRDEIVKYELEEVDRELMLIKQIFEEADKDGSGCLTKDEFHAHMTQPEVQAIYSHLELEMTE